MYIFISYIYVYVYYMYTYMNRITVFCRCGLWPWSVAIECSIPHRFWRPTSSRRSGLRPGEVRHTRASVRHTRTIAGHTQSGVRHAQASVGHARISVRHTYRRFSRHASSCRSGPHTWEVRAYS